jgi:hypothetical protein
MSFAKRLALGLILLVAFEAPAPAQFALGTLSVNLGALATLSLSSNSLSFPDSDPDAVPQVPAASGPVTVIAKARAPRNSKVTLTVIANDNLRSGVNTIPVDALTWTATGPGFVGGTMSRTTPQAVGSWSGSGARTGTQDYRFRNLWTYATGTYTVTLTYTLSAP